MVITRNQAPESTSGRGRSAKKKQTTEGEEIFGRVKISALVSLLLQYRETLDADRDVGEAARTSVESVRIAPRLADPTLAERLQYYNPPELNYNRPTLQNVLNGMGENDIRKQNKEQNNPQPPSKLLDSACPFLLLDVRDEDAFNTCRIIGRRFVVDSACPFLLLDVRDEDAFNTCRIIGAKNYPAPRINRENKYESPELLTYKNIAGKWIVFYENNEDESTRVARTLAQRGYNNVFVLSGGLSSAYTRYPKGLICGRPPSVIVLSYQSAKAKKGSSANAPYGPKLQRNQSMDSITRALSVRDGSISRGKSASRKCKDDAEAEKYVKQFYCGKVRDDFTQTDLEALKIQLQFNLLPKTSRSAVMKPTAASRARAT